MRLRRRVLAWLGIPAALTLLIANATLASPNANSSSRAVTSAANASTFEDEISRSVLEYEASRIAPGTSVPALAFTTARTAAARLSLATPSGLWSEVTKYKYDSDAQGYRDPVFSNSGGGAGLVTGRIAALAIDKNGAVYAGGADGGVWKSTDSGANWTALTDSQATLSTGAIAIDPADNSVWVGTGENNTAFENYQGIGVLRSGDAGTSWTLVGGTSLDGTTIGKLAFDGNGNVLAATSKGLFRRATSDLTSSWTKVFDAATFGDAAIPYGMSLVNDVVVRPGTNGKYIVANMSWRNGAAYDGFYVSTDGGTTFARVPATGAIVDNDLGRSSFAYSADGSTLYAVVESPFQINHFTQMGGTTLQGVYVSPTGAASGPWNKIAEGRKLATSGSALANYFIGYNPGVQAWYNQFIAVDPADKNHVYLGLEEVFETTDGGNLWNAIGPYWNFGLPCSANGLDSCPKTTHPDQHAVAIANGTVFVGNDGGVWSRSTSDHVVSGWNDLNATLRTLQYYYAGAGRTAGGDAVWGGMQDNGVSLLNPGAATMVSPFGGDGGDTLVDPNNADRAVVEYVDLDMALTTNGGRSDGTTSAWIEMTPSCFAFTYTPSPCDPNPRFIAPFRADATNLNHWVAGGEFVWDNGGAGWNTRCSSTSCNWQKVYDTGAGHSVTAIAVNGNVTYAAWCGPSGCNPKQSSTSGAGFSRGVVTNYGGGWHDITGTLPDRYVNSIAIDPANSKHIYAVLGGFSRRWIPNAGVGHVFESTNAGASWTDISGNLPDAPADDLLITAGGKLVVGTDIGVFSTSIGSTTWSRLGTGLPNAAVNDLSFAPDRSYILAATHGRGIWKISTP